MDKCPHCGKITWDIDGGLEDHLRDCKQRDEDAETGRLVRSLLEAQEDHRLFIRCRWVTHDGGQTGELEYVVCEEDDATLLDALRAAAVKLGIETGGETDAETD